jgi:hypothetical protein
MRRKGSIAMRYGRVSKQRDLCFRGKLADFIEKAHKSNTTSPDCELRSGA